MSQFGLVGKSLKYSFSKSFFTQKFETEGLNHTYENFELENIDEISSLLNSDIGGFNVTIPYKEEILPFLDEINEEALKIGAVNTVVMKKGKSIGYNTDAYGFQQSIKPFLTFEHERALILGTGGASKAVAHVFNTIGIDVLYVSRNPTKENEFAYSDLNEHMVKACKCIVNTTPVGTWPNVDELIPFPYAHLTEKHLVIDLIYNPVKTAFLAAAEQNGASILNGSSMLQHQALKAWELWNQ